MYDRSPKNQELHLTVSGLLWNRSLVMQDIETKSLWSHLLGKAMDGKLKGTTLDTIPSSMTTWGAWKLSHPGSSVLAMSRTAKKYTNAYLRHPERFVLGLRTPGAARAYSLPLLMKTPVLNDVFEEQPLVITLDPHSGGGRAFQRTVGDEVLAFVAIEPKKNGGVPGRRLMKDRASGSSWSTTSGECLAGKWKGTRLKERTMIPSYLKAWKVFHPHGSFFTPPE